MKRALPMAERSRLNGKQITNADTAALVNELQTKIGGEVRFDDGSRALYATDGSNYRQVPIGVVIPRDVDDVVQTVAICHHYGVPLLPRGGGTSLAGQCCNVAVVMDMSKYLHTIIELNPERRIARVQPGLILDHLRNEAERYHLTFGPDPATHAWCTLGGMIGNNSCGTHSVMAGMMVDNIEEMEILTYDGLRMHVGATNDADLERILNGGGRRGEIYAGLKRLRDTYGDLVRARYPKIPRRVSGYNLDQLLPENGFHVARALVGSEGTCVTILQATVRLVQSPPARSLLVIGFPDPYIAADYVPLIMEHRPVGLEGFDRRLVDNMRKKKLNVAEVALLPEGGGWLLVEFGAATREEANEQARELMEDLRDKEDVSSIRLFDHPAEAAKIWLVRESALGATVFIPGEPHYWEGWEDAAVPPEKLGGYLRDLHTLLTKYEYASALYGHFGQGCVHTRINFDLTTRTGIKKYRSFIEEAADIVVGYGGSLAGEHGDGQSRAEMLPKMFGPELVQAFNEFKAIWDPAWKMNPGKVVQPYRIDENLRLGPTYDPPQFKTHFKFPDDQGSFALATLRCVGVGKCRHTEGGTMCPSFMALREEEHTTRGRARMLFELLQGEVLKDNWRNEHVKEALDLCLACKGCKGDCPVNVDMATYKAEFLSHYYAGRLRPMVSYTIGLIYWWARFASRVPALANFFTHAPVFSHIAKTVIGIAPQRTMPTFSSWTFKGWFCKREPRNVGSPQVILWADTFNNYFHPQTAVAAVEVLEDAGYHVLVPEQSLCCGRPLYDHGLLTLAERLLRQILDNLEPHILAGIPIVGLEPSCVAVFRDELVNFFPHDENALRLKEQTFLLSEFLAKKVENYQPPKLQRKAILHGHCHQKALMRMTSEEVILKKLGVDYKLLDSGCCGMAGAFGFEKKHYDVSIKVGERVLLPAVRAADEDTLIITDGFSCREQIAQTTDREGMHLAEVIQMALHESGSKLPEATPETKKIAASAGSLPVQPRAAAIAASISAVLLAAVLLWRRGRRKQH
ncbi:MAG: FAD-binding and (Fe-S)-binding domain-containing protein [Ktedonobacteraceae bacterium]